MPEETTPPAGEVSKETAAETVASGPAAEVPVGAEEESARQAAEAGAPEAVPLAALPATDLLTSFLSLMAMKAWEGMGLVANPLSGKTQKNLDDARLAIDAYAAVFELLRTRIEEQPRRELENVLTMLRVNFVEKSGG